MMWLYGVLLDGAVQVVELYGVLLDGLLPQKLPSALSRSAMGHVLLAMLACPPPAGGGVHARELPGGCPRR